MQMSCADQEYDLQLELKRKSNNCDEIRSFLQQKYHEESKKCQLAQIEDKVKLKQAKMDEERMWTEVHVRKYKMELQKEHIERHERKTMEQKILQDVKHQIKEKSLKAAQDKVDLQKVVCASLPFPDHDPKLKSLGKAELAEHLNGQISLRKELQRKRDEQDMQVIRQLNETTAKELEAERQVRKAEDILLKKQKDQFYQYSKHVLRQRQLDEGKLEKLINDTREKFDQEKLETCLREKQKRQQMASIAFEGQRMQIAEMEARKAREREERQQESLREREQHERNRQEAERADCRIQTAVQQYRDSLKEQIKSASLERERNKRANQLETNRMIEPGAKITISTMSEKEKSRRKRASSDPDTEEPEKSAPEEDKDAAAEEEDDDGGWIGPLPSAAAQPKKRKVLEFEKLYVESLPDAECYEKSFMHRDTITHLVVTKSEFIVTVSVDGHVKFWKKMELGIEFVKHFRSHLAPINYLAVNCSGTYLCTASVDKSIKVFDVINFDMINMLKLEYVPYRVEWIHRMGDVISYLAVADQDSPVIRVYDGKGTNTPLHTLEKLHTKPVVMLRYNPSFEVTISIDKAGILEYWYGPRHDFKFPTKLVHFESKLDTSLYEFAKNKTTVTSLSFSPDGKKFATMSTDRQVRVFGFLSGKLLRVYDESLARYSESQQLSQTLSNMEFGRRMANERDLEKSDAFANMNVAFDYSGHFILYPTMLGIKLVNIETNRCAKIIGKNDNLRPLNLALFQGKVKFSKAATTLEQEASENKAAQATPNDPTLFCTAYKKQRFYLYTRRLPSDLQDMERDVFNEKPSKEDIISVTEGQGVQKIYDNAVLHTTMGDVHMRLFGKECPKTVENFCVHSKNGYYNGHLFHRVIKGFMIQTGDPTGTGTGGQSIWGGEFKDEFCSTLKHDRPYTVSMANAGPSTNGSQFFITVLPTPWLDNKHTVFGRVHKGMEIVQNICNAKTNPKTDKPYDEIRIISINLSTGWIGWPMHLQAEVVYPTLQKGKSGRKFGS
uniref:peptidylprolyl isomerase n=1 Tax=Anopheles dirus TaxID=7168 RepID=A0A182NGS0_9DIPT